jgi:hypothetical protein
LNRKGILQYLGIKHHEYWSWWLLVIPIWPLWIWYAILLRCPTWFTVVNAGMEDSGFVGESKIEILKTVPDHLKPVTIFVPLNTRISEVQIKLNNAKQNFPVICKPDIGGRGRKVEIISSFEELENYHHDVAEDYMIQQIIPFEHELGVFYVRVPNEEKGRVTSVAIKGFLKVKGDGRSSIQELMEMDYRASMQIERLREKIDMNEIPEKGKIVLLEPIGNHCRGTSFMNGHHLINEKLNEVFDTISNQIEGFNYGRYDLRVKSLEDLYEGKNIFILELNGLTADAAHIFDPHYRLRDAYRTQIKQCKISYQIAKINLKDGVKPTPLFTLISKSWKYFRNG